MARKPRDYQLEYERRRIRAEGRGFRSPREETQYKAAQKGREKKQTLVNYRRQQSAKLARYSKERILKKYKISEYRFNQMRKQNKAFSAKTKSPKLIYNLDVDLDTQNYSDTRIGYIVGYNTVFVNPKQNKNKRDRERYARLIEKYRLFYDDQDQDIWTNTSGKERIAA